jgi:TRAP-type C4-dicarboxylate transport system permease small subunit
MSRSARRLIPIALEEGIAVACMVLLVVITLGNVLVRYFSDQSFAWTEEISVFLMVVMTWAGASAAAADDKHIRIEFFYEAGSAERQRLLRIVVACITALCFLLLAVVFARVVADEVKWAETTMGLGLPRWWFTVFSPILCVAIALRSAGFAWRAAKQAA